MRKGMLIKLVSIGLMCLLLLPGVFAAGAEAPAKKVTVMVYMCGSNLESDNAQASRELSNFKKSRFNLDEVNLVVLLGGTIHWWTGYDANSLTLVQVEGGRLPTTVDTYDWTSMGEAETLRKFLDVCHERFPAESYDLVLWDHGGGPNSGVCFDDVYERKYKAADSLSIAELETALGESSFGGGGLDIIAFHACLMGSAEVATRIAPYARYMVATEEVNYGLDYHWLNGIENEDPYETAMRIVDGAYAQNGDQIKLHEETLANVYAVIDLSRMQALNDAVDAFFDSLNPDLNDESFTTFSKVRRDATVFGIGEAGPVSDCDLVDLGDLVNHYRDMAPDAANALLAALEETVPYRRADPVICSGLSVYHPYRNKYASPFYVSEYPSLGFSEAYTRYVQKFGAILVGTPMANWTEMDPERITNRAKRVRFTLRLSEDQANHYGDSAFEALLKHDDGTYQFAAIDDDVQLVDGKITADYPGRAVYVVDDDGNALFGPLEYSADGDVYTVSATLHMDAAETVPDGDDFIYGHSEADHKARISLSLDAGTGALTPCGVSVYDEGLGQYTTIFNTQYDMYQSIRLETARRVCPETGDAALPAFSEWEIAATDSWDGAIDGSWHFKRVEDPLPIDGLWACFQVTDSQNNVYSSAPLAFEARHSDDWQIIYDDIQFLVAGSRITARPDNLVISLSLKNQLDREVYYVLTNLTVGDSAVDGEADLFGDGPNGGLTQGGSGVLSGMFDLSGAGDSAELSFDIEVYDAGTDELISAVAVHVLNGGGEA